MGFLWEVWQYWGSAPLLWDPLSSPFVLGIRIGGSPDFDRFVVSHGRWKTQGIACVGNEFRPPPLWTKILYVVVERLVCCHYFMWINH